MFTGIYDQFDNSQQQLNPRKYEILSMDFEYDPGFKVALGYDFGCDGWGISAEYTRFHQTVKSSKNLSDRTGILQDGSSTSQIVPGWFFNNNSSFGNYRFAVTSIQTADASWKLSVDLLDIELSRSAYMGKCLIMRPYSGLRAGWIDQNYSAKYKGFEEFTPAPGDFNNYQMNEKVDSWGIGPLIGLDLKWLLSCGFSFISEFSLSTLYTEYDINVEAFRQITTSGSLINPDNSDYCYDDDQCYIRPQMALTLGFSWEDYFCCQKYYGFLFAGYTFNIFWDQNMFLNYQLGNFAPPTTGYGAGNINQQIVAEGGNLYLHGFTLTARMDF